MQILKLPEKTKTMKKNRRNRHPHRSGFTLVEVMIVLFILVTLAGMAVLTFQGTRERSKRQAAYTYIQTLSTAVEAYEMHMGRYPTQEQGLSALITVPSDVLNPNQWGGPYLKSKATSLDPWMNEYQYECPGRHGTFDIWSNGAGITDNDIIGNWMNSKDI